MNHSDRKSYAEILTALWQVRVSHTRHSVFPENKILNISINTEQQHSSNKNIIKQLKVTAGFLQTF